MKKTKLENLDLTLYEETLENGLQVKILPNKNVNSQYATFTTFYGSRIDEFVPRGSKKMVKVPHGIAHFLEHKMFGQPDGGDAINLFSERGASANAYTSFNRTVYQFSGNTCFAENLTTLLDFVQELYITEENVEREKGIIIQEAKMYLDRPGSRLYYSLLDQVFSKDPVRYPGIGSVDDIKAITVEELKMCYETFYHPSNMMLVISGNVDPEETLNLIKENQKKKQFGPKQEIKLQTYQEPKHLHKKKIVFHMNVEIPKISYNIKVDMRQWNEQDKMNRLPYLSFFFDIHFGTRSTLVEKLKKEGIITSSLGVMMTDYGDYLVIAIDGESEKPNDLLNAIEKEMKNTKITDEDFERYKKILISNRIYQSDDIYMMNDRIVWQMTEYHRVLTDEVSRIRSFRLEEYQKVMKEISLKESGYVLLLPTERQEL